MSLNANANTHAHAHAHADDIGVGLFDSILGRFNPFRNPEMTSTTAAPVSGSSTANETLSPSDSASTSSSTVQDQSAPADSTPDGASDQRSPGLLAGVGAVVSVKKNVDMGARVHEAVRLRRAEISEMRDQAMTSANTEMMANADRMETMLNAFENAQVQATANATGNAEYQAGQPKPADASTGSNGQTEGGVRNQPSRAETPSRPVMSNRPSSTTPRR